MNDVIPGFNTPIVESLSVFAHVLPPENRDGSFVELNLRELGQSDDDPPFVRCALSVRQSNDLAALLLQAAAEIEASA